MCGAETSCSHISRILGLLLAQGEEEEEEGEGGNGERQIVRWLLNILSCATVSLSLSMEGEFGWVMREE